MRGAAIRYSVAELAFIEARQTMPRRVLRDAFADAFRRDEVKVDDIKALCARKGWSTRRRWSAAEDIVIRALYPDVPTAQLAGCLARPLSAVYQRARVLHLAKSAAFLASPAAGRTNGRQGIGSRFPKGHVPANKGVVRGRGWAPGRMKEGQFRKGERRGVAVKLYQPIGTERLSKDGYLERKINDGLPLQRRWRAVHLVRWEEINGPLPEGHALKSLDGNRQNTDPSNWSLVPRALLPRLNGGRGRRLGYDAAPAELKPTIMAAAKLVHAVRERTKHAGVA